MIGSEKTVVRNEGVDLYCKGRGVKNRKVLAGTAAEESRTRFLGEGGCGLNSPGKRNGVDRGRCSASG